MPRSADDRRQQQRGREMNNIRRSKRAAERFACGYLLVRDQSHDDELQSDQRASG